MKRTLLLLPMVIAACGAVRAQEESFDLGEIAPAKPPSLLYTSHFEVGAGYQSLDSFHFGRYGGVTDKGPFAILNGTFDGGDSWNEGKKFWDASINLYGADNLSGDIRAGVQGLWRARAFYDGFTRAYSDTARTPFFGIGSDRLSLPDNWVTGASSAQFTRLESSAKPVDLKVAWRSTGGEFVLVPYTGYEFKIQFAYRKREGLRPQSISFGQEGNYAVGVFFPQPVDYDSSQITASFGFANAKLQWNASYNFAVFSNGVDSITVPNPYSRSLNSLPGNAWPAAAFAGYPFAVGQYGLPPDSAAHHFQLTGGYAVSAKTRLTARLSYQIQTQDDPFLPYTGSAVLNVRTALPRDSLNGKVRKTNLAVTLTSRELKDADFSASYTYDDRHNLSPVNLYSYVGGDAQDQLQPIIPGNTRYIRRNLPYSFTFNDIKAEAGYRITPRTRLSLSYAGDFRERDYQQAAKTKEHTFKAKALSTFEQGSAWVSASYATRDAGNYDEPLPWVLSHTDAYLDASDTRDGIEHPLMRKYNLADRRRSEAKGGLTLEASQNIAIDISSSYGKDNYLHSAIGLRSSKSARLDADVSYVLAKTLTASVFAGVERIRAALNGYLIFDSVQGNPNRQWSVGNRDAINSAGVKLDWQVVPEKFKLDGSYSLSDGTTRIDVQSYQGFLGTVSSPLPAARDITHTGSIAGEYAFRPNTALRLGYTIADHSTRDWQYANMGLAPVAQIVGSGIIPPRYTVHVVWLTTRYQF